MEPRGTVSDQALPGYSQRSASLATALGSQGTPSGPVCSGRVLQSMGGLGSQTPVRSSCVALVELVNLSMLPFSHLGNWEDNDNDIEGRPEVYTS